MNDLQPQPDDRLYFLVPDIDRAKAVVATLREEFGLGDDKISVIANAGTPLEDLPKATLDESSDFVPAVGRGVAAGGTAGLVAGLMAVAFPPAGLVFGGGIVLSMTAIGASFGLAIAGMVGASVPNSRVQEFADAVDAGQLLMLVDVSPDDSDGAIATILRSHPEASIERADRENA